MNRKNTRLFNGPGFDGRLGPFDAYKLIGKRFASSKTRTTAPGQPLPSVRSLHGGQGGECQLLPVTSGLGRGAGRCTQLPCNLLTGGNTELVLFLHKELCFAPKNFWLSVLASTFTQK